MYLDGDRLVYVKDECRGEDIHAGFFLHLWPFDEADLPRRRKRYGFDNLDFAFPRYGLRAGGRCVAVLTLPEYEVAGIYTGQYTHGRGLDWSGRVGFEGDPP